MKSKHIPSTVDLTLTPENASQRGYAFVNDVTNPYYAFHEILELEKKKGLILDLRVMMRMMQSLGFIVK